MANQNKLFNYSILLSTFLIASSTASAGDIWDTTIGVQGSTGDYSGSEYRDQKTNYGLFLTTNYLDSYGATFVYSRGDYDFTTQNNQKNITEDMFFLSGYKNFRPDGINGQLTLNIDAFYIDNTDETKFSDNVNVLGTQLAYLTFDKNYYGDLGYTRSNYYGGLNINQWTPTFGFGFNQQKDWIQVRGYFISANHRSKTRTQNKKNTQAADISLTHFFISQPYMLNKLKVSTLIGERFFAVDRDSASVYNLDDTQKGSISALAEFQLTSSTKLTVVAGRDRYKKEYFGNTRVNDSYSSTYMYTALSTTW